jgi:hypothetical protein
MQDERRDHGRFTADADEIEAEWERSLDAATEAVASYARAGTLGQSELAAESKVIREERQWLIGYRTSLRRLFPRRRRNQG